MKKMLKLIKRYKLSFFFNWKLIEIRTKYPRVYFNNTLNIGIKDFSKLYIGDGVSLGSFTTIIVAEKGKDNNCSSLKIGNNCYIGEYNNIRAGGGSITIGNDCLISQHISIVASNHSFKKDSLIREQEWSTINNFVIIGDDVWIGANTVILPGVKIGTGAVIGSGSVVTKDIPKYAVAFGNPARIQRYRG